MGEEMAGPPVIDIDASSESMDNPVDTGSIVTSNSAVEKDSKATLEPQPPSGDHLFPHFPMMSHLTKLLLCLFQKEQRKPKKQPTKHRHLFCQTRLCGC